jgi:hypothetical protein
MLDGAQNFKIYKFYNASDVKGIKICRLPGPGHVLETVESGLAKKIVVF